MPQRATPARCATPLRRERAQQEGRAERQVRRPRGKAREAGQQPRKRTKTANTVSSEPPRRAPSRQQKAEGHAATPLTRDRRRYSRSMKQRSQRRRED